MSPSPEPPVTISETLTRVGMLASRAMPARRERLSAAEARRAALAAQGFGARAPRTLRGMLDRIALVQIDSVNVLVRAHYLPAFSRLGTYETGKLDRLAHRAPRRLFEYWGHEASLIRVDLQPLLRWRMARAANDAWGRMRRLQRDHPHLVDEVLAAVRERGPVAASALSDGRPKRSGWWEWSEVKTACEWLFWSGQITAARRAGFERLYDVPERVLPRAVVQAPTPDVADAQRGLVRVAARALGVAAERDLRDYFRLPAADARGRVSEMAAVWELVPVTVEGWREAAYLHPDARVPRRVEARALLGPFDPLLWERSRVERLFGVRFRLEIYVPAPKRVHGYYVLPFLLGDELVARVDLKADRAAGVLLVQNAHDEPGAPPETGEELRGELSRMARWLGLERVRVAGGPGPARARPRGRPA